MASEIIARAVEGKVSALSTLSNKEVTAEFASLDQELGIVRRLTEAVAQNPEIRRSKHTLLVFWFAGDERLSVRTFDSITPAQQEYERLGSELGSTADVVLVRAERAEDLKKAFQNYFTDASDFIDLVTSGREKLLT